MNIALIAALHWPTSIIGIEGQLPWDRPEDLKRFRSLTMGDAVLMGRRTFESLPGSHLPGRENLVLSSHKPDYEPEEVSSFPSIHQALQAASAHDQLWIAGGATLYRQLAGYANEMYLTWVHERPDEEFNLSEKSLSDVTYFPDRTLQLLYFAFEHVSSEKTDGCVFRHHSRPQP